MPAKHEHTATAPATAKRPEFRIQRVFDAPRRLVFEAWSKPEHLSRWFAPDPLTTPRCEIDFRPGGAFRLTMLTPDGLEFPFEAVFGEIVPPERLVFTGKIHDGNDVHTTVTFTEVGGKTTLSVHQVFAFESDATRGAPVGWAKTLDQLGQHVARP